MTFEEMVKKADAQVVGDVYVELMDKARNLANNGFFTDNREEWDENEQYLVADMDDIIKAWYNDLAIKKVFGIDPAEADDGAEVWCKRHGIEILG
jgi:hypothetical protein